MCFIDIKSKRYHEEGLPYVVSISKPPSWRRVI